MDNPDIPYYQQALKEAQEKLALAEQELKKVREELERTIDLLEASQEISQTAGWEYDVKNNTIIRTKQMIKMLGAIPADATLQDAAKLYEADDERAIIEGMRDAILHHTMYDLELRSRGSQKWLRTIGKPVVKDGKIEMVRGAVMDITDRKERELALREIGEKLERSNLLLDFSQELSGTAGWEIDLKTGEIFWTRQAYLLHDVDEDFKPTLQSILGFYEPADMVRLEHAAQQAILDDKPYDIELRLITARNVHKWVRSIGMPVTRNGEVVFVKGALMDITQKKHAELELIRARNVAEESARAKTDFLSVMSHEIRTPLNGIIGIANLLKLNYTPEQKEYITNLIFCADHLLQLINDILDLTKMESDKLELIRAPVDLLQLVNNIKNQFGSLAEAKGIRLLSFVDNDLPANMLADPIRLGQILNNLVSNAIKFTEEGAVTIRVSLVTVTADRVVLHFSISDSGIGIPEELQETIFESFRQVQQSAYRKHSGTGLGLTITRKLVELHNSRIFISSLPGQGTEFYFDLSFDRADGEAGAAALAANAAFAGYEKRLTGLRMLFVEDNPINVMVAMKQLEYFGIRPDCAESGREALVFLKDHDYHVVLLDLHMPEIDGYALAEIIRRQYPGIHIIIFTADIMTEVRAKLAVMNIYDILNKPFAPEKMYEILFKVARAKNVLPVELATNNSPTK